MLAVRRSNHALFFGRGFFLLEFRILGIFRVFFTFVRFRVVVAMIAMIHMVIVHAGIRGRISRSEHAILRIARRIIVLSVGNVFRQSRSFFFGQIHMRMLFVTPNFMMSRFVVLHNLRSITQFEILADLFRFIPVARILCATRLLNRRLLHMRVRSRQGIHFRPGRHQWRKRREANRVRNRRVVLRLACLRFRSQGFGSQGFGRKMRMRLPLR